MSVDDHGLEAIRKAADPVRKNRKDDYVIKTKAGALSDNTVEVIRTDITTSVKKIDLPEKATKFILFHRDADILYFGKDESITTSSNSAPLISDTFLNLELSKKNNNNLYGIASSGTITVYAIGVYRE